MRSLFNESHSKFINLAVKNPTQLDALRFKKGINAPLESRFTKSKGEFDGLLKTKLDRLKSRFDKLEL